MRWFTIPISSWITDLFIALDEERFDAFCGYLDPECCFVFGNDDPVKGRSNIRDAVNGFYLGIEGSNHAILETVTTPARAIVRGRVTYTERGGQQRRFPFVNVFELESDLITVYQIYVDNHELEVQAN